MKLTLLAIMPSPVNLPNSTTWVLETTGTFLISDRYKIVEVGHAGHVRVIWQALDDEVAYAMKGYCEERLPDELYEEIRERGIDGFRLLKKSEYKNIDQPNGSSSLMETAKAFGLLDQNFPVLAHNIIVSLGKKSIHLMQPNEGMSASISKVTSKTPTCTTLHPTQNLIIYGTNRGELYGQYFDKKGFGKTVKIDQLPNTCYQLLFDRKGDNLIVCGMGYLRIFDFQHDSFKQKVSLMTACKSFVLAGDYIILNKGMHGIDVLHIRNEPKRVTSIDVPFSIEKMEYLSSWQTLLITSGSSQEIGIILCEEMYHK